MPAEESKEILTARAQLVRLFEASAQIEHPNADERNFRLAVMKKLGVAFDLKEVKNHTIVGPNK